MSLLIRNLNKSTNNTISRAKPCILQILPPHFSQQSQSLQVVQQQQVRWGRTVRIILQNDLPSGKGYAGDVMEVKAGYARNHLIPQKIAYYATPENFERFNITDPLLLKKDGLSKEEEDDGKEDKVEVSEDQKEADRLRKYLKNKTLKIWRNIDASTGKCHPGMVNAKALRDKLSKQLKIDLEDHETIQVHPEQVNFLELDMEERQIREMEQQLKLQELQQRQQQQNSSSVVGNESTEGEGVPQVEKKKLGGIEGYIAQNIKEYDAERDDSIELKDLGEYIAMIHLAGGFSVPLKFVVLKR